MSSPAQNPNLSRRSGPGLAAALLAPALKPLLRLLKSPQRAAGAAESPFTVFQAYMVGDFFMALPALKKLARGRAETGSPVRVLCRPDCVELLAREGLTGIPFDNAFLRPGVASFVRTWRSAWSLRGRLGDVALDLDADPRTAFWLKVAGVRRVLSYRRAYGTLFDETFELGEPSVHQTDRDMRVVETWLNVGGTQASPLQPHPHISPNAPWILSVWTRKAAKNWPLDRWETLMENLLAEGVVFTVLDPPDGDAAFAAFRARWENRVKFLRDSLPGIADAVRASAGVLATDNFLGHMAGYYGRPVLWINLCSPAAQVTPRGPRTLALHRPSAEEAWRAFARLREP